MGSQCLLGIEFQIYKVKIFWGENSLAVQWLGPGTLTAEGPGSIPGQGTKISEVTWCGQKKEKKNYGDGQW